jgi:hypothetical protein
MKITDRSLAAFAMTLCHSISVDTNNATAVKGVYVLVMLSERDREDDITVNNIQEFNEKWAEWTGRKLAELSGGQERTVKEEHKKNMVLYTKTALSTLRNVTNYQHAIAMAVAFGIIPSPGGTNEPARPS